MFPFARKHTYAHTHIQKHQRWYMHTHIELFPTLDLDIFSKLSIELDYFHKMS